MAKTATRKQVSPSYNRQAASQPVAADNQPGTADYELDKSPETVQQRLMERTKSLEEAQALTHLGNWQWDVATNKISWSDELYRIYGLRPQEREVGFDAFMGMIHQDDRARVQAIIGQASQDGRPFEFEHRIVRPNGSQRYLFGMGKVQKDDAGNMLRMIGTSQDITERRTVERALQQSDERFRAVTKATHDLVYDMNLRNNTIWFNESLQSEYGHANRGEEDRTIDWWIGQLHPDDSEIVAKQIEQLVASGKQQSWTAEYRFRKADGSYALLRNRAFMLLDTLGEPERIVGSCLDITEARQLERAKDEFISLVSHQLRTPLTIIRLYGNMLTDGIAGPLASEQQNYVSKITDASIRLIKLVGDILSISRLELNRIKIEPRDIDVNEIIQACIDELSPLAASRGAKIIFRPDRSLEPVGLDTTIFGEIVNNLISNALRYVRANDGQVQVRFSKQRQGYVLTVRDNGIGIPRTAQPHIFERFFRAANAARADGEGTGLGLYLVKLFAEAAGGKAWFQSKVGKGTVFYVLLPSGGMRPRQPKGQSQG